MPDIGDRVFVCPRAGRSVQRGEGLFGQYLLPKGQEVTWDAYLQARLDEGCVLITNPPEPEEVI